MATKEMQLPEKLSREIEKIALAQGREPSEVLAEAVDRYVKDRQWAGLKTYGRAKARERGLQDSDVEPLVEESRQEHGR